MVRGKKERASTSNTTYLVVPEDEPAAKKCKKDEVVSSEKVEKVEESESWDTLSEERFYLFVFLVRSKKFRVNKLP